MFTTLSKNKFHINGNIIMLAAFIFFFFAISSAAATTFYVDGNALDDTGNGSRTSPKKFIQSGLDLLSETGGDELIIANGTYTSSQDWINYNHVPSGTSYTTIRAETDWGVTINYPFILGDDHHQTNYIIIQGIRFVSPGGTVGGSQYIGQHAKFIKCAFVNSLSEHYGENLNIGCKPNNAEYVLVEDCYAYGLGGRYKFKVQSSSKVIFRRCVARSDGGWGNAQGNPEAVFMTYNAENVLWQNCIAIDSNLTYEYWNGAFYVANKGGADFPIKLNNVKWEGCIAINVRGHGFHMDLDLAARNLSISNSAILYKDNPGYAIFSYKNNADLSIENVTILNADRGINEDGSGGTINAANFIVVDSLRENLRGNIATNGYYSSFKNGQAVDGATFTQSPYSNGLTYPIRIEDGSPLKTAGENQTQLGAEITHQIGKSSTMFGENGYNSITTLPLWPFPNEVQIRNDMRSLPSIGTRGFCADGQTLTKYITEFCGGTCPYLTSRPQIINISIN